MGRKTLWEKEKLLVTSNFSYSHCVFKRLVLQTGKNQGLFGKGLKGHSSSNQHIFIKNKKLLTSKEESILFGQFFLERKREREREREIEIFVTCDVGNYDYVRVNFDPREREGEREREREGERIKNNCRPQSQRKTFW